MRKKSGWLLLSLGLVLALQGAAQTAPTETQLQVQAPAALTKPVTPACKPPCLTAEQEAALVEVRKILKEARQVAEGIELPSRLTTRGMVLKDLQASKDRLINEIEEAQFRIGDFSTAAKTKRPWSLALAQAKYGQVKEAVQTAARAPDYITDTLLVLVDALIKAGDISAALTVAEAKLNKQSLEHWRYRDQASIFSLIARRQHEKGDPAARITLERALKAANALSDPKRFRPLPDHVIAWIHIAKTQAVMGDHSGSADSFRQAIQAARTIKRDGTPESALASIAVAQAESGDQEASAETFQESIRLTNELDAKDKVFRLVRTACSQVMRGHRASGIQTFQQAMQIAEGLPPIEKGRVLREIVDWQIKAGEREAVAETLERARKAGVDVTTLAAKAGYLRLALELAGTISDVWNQSGVLAFIALRLVETKDPFGTPEVFQQLSQTATALLKEPVPKDNSRANHMFMNIALVQASAGDLPTALRTIEMISGDSYLERIAYTELIKLLTTQGKLADAQQVADGRKDDWVLAYTRVRWDIASLGVRAGNVQDTLAWARKQPEGFAQGYALLGVAEELMKQKGIENIGKLLPETPLLRGKSPCA
jgi:tetratricopeptide (TPR) repeat protein